MSRSSRSRRIRHLVEREADAAVFRAGRRVLRAPAAARVSGGVCDESAEQLARCGPSAAGTGCGRPAGSRPARPTAAGQHRAQGEAAAADVELVRGRPQARGGSGLGGGGQSSASSATSSVDPVLGPDDDRAERDEVGVGRSAVVHGHAEEPGDAEGLDVGRDSSRWRRNDSSRSSRQQTTWKRGAGGRPCVLPGVQGHGVEGLRAESPLVGQVEDAPAFDSGRTPRSLQQGRPLLGRLMIETSRWQPEDLGQLEHEEGPLLDARRPAAGRCAGEWHLAARSAAGRIPASAGPRGPPPADPAGAGPPGTRQAACGTGRNAVAADLDLPDHAPPAAQGQERAGEEGIPFFVGHAQLVERLADRFQRLVISSSSRSSSCFRPRSQLWGGPTRWR